MKFKAKTKELKTALGIANLASSTQSDSLNGHSLFQIDGSDLKIFSTDKDRVSKSSCTVDPDEQFEPMDFTADAKKIISLLNSSNLEEVSFSYNQENKTLNVYASEDPGAYLSFPSLDSSLFEAYLDFSNDMENVKTINAGLFMAGLSFIEGFLSEKNKDEKFSRLYISDSVMYGANGSNRVGAFTSPDYKGIDSLIIRKAMLHPIVSMINLINVEDLSIHSNGKFLYFSCGNSGFGFLNVTDAMIDFPVDLDKPETDAFQINKDVFLKKINRLAIAGEGDVGIKAKVDTSRLEMSTFMERSSTEAMPVTRTYGNEEVEFYFVHKLMKSLISPFQAPEIDIYLNLKEFRLIARSEAEMEIGEKGSEEKTVKKFKAVGLIGLGTPDDK